MGSTVWPPHAEMVNSMDKIKPNAKYRFISIALQFCKDYIGILPPSFISFNKKSSYLKMIATFLHFPPILRQFDYHRGKHRKSDFFGFYVRYETLADGMEKSLPLEGKGDRASGG